MRLSASALSVNVWPRRRAFGTFGALRLFGYRRFRPKHGIIGGPVILRELRHPIVLAPLAGGPSTPALAAAVSDAGGLGFLASGYGGADQMSADIRAVRALTRAPFGVNLFVLSSPDVDKPVLQAYVERLRAAEAARYETDPAEPHFEDD